MWEDHESIWDLDESGTKGKRLMGEKGQFLIDLRTI